MTVSGSPDHCFSNYCLLSNFTCSRVRRDHCNNDQRRNMEWLVSLFFSLTLFPLFLLSPSSLFCLFLFQISLFFHSFLISLYLCKMISSPWMVTVKAITQVQGSCSYCDNSTETSDWKEFPQLRNRKEASLRGRMPVGTKRNDHLCSL